MMLLWLQPLNTSTNIALAYNATIFCADQAADELDVANLPDQLTVANLAVEAILSYNNDANYLLQVRHLKSAATWPSASQVCFCQTATPQKAHAVSMLRW